MMVSLGVSALVSLVAFAFLIWVGWVVGQRPASSGSGARIAGAGFAAFWYAWAAVSGVAGVTKLLAATGDPPLTLVVGLQFLSMGALCMGLAGLLYYLVYLYTGRTRMFWPLVIGYAVAAGGVIRMLSAWQPTGLVRTSLEATVVYARTASDASVLLMLLVLIGPQLLASLALFVLAARLPGSASRVRVWVVAAAILGWFGSGFLGALAGWSDHAAWQIIELLVPVLSGLSVFLVHRPPPWLERRMPPELPADSTGLRPVRRG